MTAGFTRISGYYFAEYDEVLVAPPLADEDKHEINNTITRPLTAIEQAAYESSWEK